MLYISSLKLVRKQSVSKLLWPLLELDIFQVSLKVSFISVDIDSEICFRAHVGSPQLPLKGIGLSGELAETWPNLLPPSFPWGSSHMGSLQDPLGVLLCRLQE